MKINKLTEYLLPDFIRNRRKKKTLFILTDIFQNYRKCNQIFAIRLNVYYLVFTSMTAGLFEFLARSRAFLISLGSDTDSP